MASPNLLDLNGHCGGVPSGGGKLPVLVGEPMESCPTAMGLHDDHVLLLADMVPSGVGAGALAGVPRYTLPPYYRAVLEHADAWLMVRKAQTAQKEEVPS